MKKFAYILPLALLAACQGNTNQDQATETELVAEPQEQLAFFGERIEPEGAVPASEVKTAVTGNDSVRMKIEGTIEEVCQVKGCWVTMQTGDDESMRVTFKDYAIFLPKDVGGKTAILEGYAFVDTTSVEMLRHYAEDAGETEEAIAAITEPEVDIRFLADAVIIRDYKMEEGPVSEEHEGHDHEGHGHEGHNH